MPVLARIALSTLVIVEFTAFTVSIPLRYETCGGTGGMSAGRLGLGISGAGYGGPMGGSVAAAGAFAADGSFWGAAATDCGLAVADGVGLWGLVAGLVIGRDDFAAAPGDRGTTCVRYTGVPGCCPPAAVPVRIWAGFCMPGAERPKRMQVLQIVRENRNIAFLSIWNSYLILLPLWSERRRKTSLPD